MKIFLDVVQAFASILVALSLTLPARNVDTDLTLSALGFTATEIEETWSENAQSQVWSRTSPHLRELVSAFQEWQWNSVDFAPGIATATHGTSAGVPLAGLVAALALSKITRRILARLEALDLLAPMDTTGAHDFFDPSGRFQ